MTPEQEQWEKVGRIVNAAACLPPDEWPSLLDQECRQDEALRSMVEFYLSLDGKDDKGFLSAPAIEHAAKLFTRGEPRFPAGKRLGNYEVLEFVAAAGMGEIYKARNVTLGSLVALKFLPHALAQDANGLRRLKQEARAASALNHPNIVTVHDFVEAEHSHFIVSEYVEGKTLREILRHGRMDLKVAINFATQFASGLEAAHTVGVIHRDIKPENIMLRPDHYVKILDFGLAKLTERFSTNLSEHSQFKTEHEGLLGTPRYMSPEQVRGLELDVRTDVWSLGVVMYEMLSGHAPFQGETSSDVHACVLEREPTPLSSVAPHVPAKLRRIVVKALQKDRDQRYNDIKEMLLDLQSVDKKGESFWDKIKQYDNAAAVILSGLVAAVLSSIPPGPPPKPPQPPMKVVPLTSFFGFEESPSFSPDGKYMAFTWGGEKGDNVDIYVQTIGSTDPPFRLTTDPGVDMNPVWSPDGTKIAFARVKSDTEKAGYVKPWPSGPERKIYSPTVPASWGGQKQQDWSPDGKWIASPDKLSENGPNQIILLSPESLEHYPLTFPPENSFGDLNAQFSPDGQSVSFVRSSSGTPGTQDIYIVPVTGGQPRRVTFDNVHIENPTWTADGREIVFASNRGGMMNLWRIPVSGGEAKQLPVGEFGATAPTISRQGNRLAFVQNTSDSNMYRLSLEGSRGKESTMIASSTQYDCNPSFSPDSKQIAFESERSGQHEIWVSDRDGTNPTQLTSLGSVSGSPFWSPDGQQIAFDSQEKIGATRDIYVVNSQGGSSRLLTPVDDYDDMVPCWSRDGQWIYFTSNRSGDWQVWKVSPTKGDLVQVTRHGGGIAFEAEDGKYLYYGKQKDPGIWKVPVDGGDEVPVLELSKVEGFWCNWAVAKEGIYFINPEPKTGAEIQFFNFATRKIRTVASLGKVNVAWFGFGVSPDEKFAMYTLVDHEGSDTMLVENFH